MRRVALVLATVLPLALAGCGDSTGPGIAGTYDLRSLNGDPVPILVASGPPRQEITEGFVRLNSNGTFSASHTLLITGSSGSTTELTENIDGTYTRSGDNLTLRFEDPDGGEQVEFDAFVEGRRLTVDDSFDTWVYER